jgi:hypothetical protein
MVTGVLTVASTAFQATIEMSTCGWPGIACITWRRSSLIRSPGFWWLSGCGGHRWSQNPLSSWWATSSKQRSGLRPECLYAYVDGRDILRRWHFLTLLVYSLCHEANGWIESEAQMAPEMVGDGSGDERFLSVVM